MTELRTMPRASIALAGLVIAGCALAGLSLGVMGKLKSPGGGDLNSGEEVAPIKTVANATPLTSPPVTEADVRRWVREELGSRPVAPKKPRADVGDQADTGDSADAPPPPTPGASPTTAGPPPASAAPKNQTSGQIPF